MGYSGLFRGIKLKGGDGNVRAYNSSLDSALTNPASQQNTFKMEKFFQKDYSPLFCKYQPALSGHKIKLKLNLTQLFTRFGFVFFFGETEQGKWTVHLSLFARKKSSALLHKPIQTNFTLRKYIVG